MSLHFPRASQAQHWGLSTQHGGLSTQHGGASSHSALPPQNQLGSSPPRPPHLNQPAPSLRPKSSLPHPPSLGIAFFRGAPYNPWASLIRNTTGGPYVHSEILIHDGASTCSFSSFQGYGGFVQSQSVYTPQEWDILLFPLSQQAYDFSMYLAAQLHSLHLPYNYTDLCQCWSYRCWPHLFLPLRSDLDCTAPSTWSSSGVFCSQVCLLFLRRLVHEGLLSLSPDTAETVATTNSRACSPNALYSMLAPKPEKKSKG